MKRQIWFSTVLILCLSVLRSQAQPGPGAGSGSEDTGPKFDGRMCMLFGTNAYFSALIETESKGGAAGAGTVTPGKLAYSEGKSRLEVDVAEIKGAPIPPTVITQLKTMGLDRMVMVDRPDKKIAYRLYPGVQSYIQIADPTLELPSTNEFKVASSEQGKEKLDGHPCVKNKSTVTDSKGKKQEYTVWNATDLKNFPLKIESVEDGVSATMVFKDVKLSKPDAALFEPGLGFDRFDSMPELLQAVMVKKFGNGPAIAPGTPPAQ